MKTNAAGWSFNEEDHEYKNPQGLVVPGISAILRAGGLLDEMRAAKSAMSKGSRVHKAIEFDWENDLDEESVDPDEIGFVHAWRAAVKELGIEIEGVEVLAGHSSMQYASQIDAIAKWEGRLTVCNWKTGRKYAWYPVQSAGEAILFEQPVLPRRLTVYLQANGKWKYDEHTAVEDFEEFKRCHKAYQESLVAAKS